MLNSSSLVLAHTFQKAISMKNGKAVGDWKAVEGFYTCPLGVVSEKDQVEEQVVCADETGSFSECVVFLLIKVL